MFLSPLFSLQEVSCKPQDLLAEMIVEDPWDMAFREVLCRWDYVKVRLSF